VPGTDTIRASFAPASRIPVTVLPLIVTRYTGVNCLGRGVEAWWGALRSRRSALAPCDFEDAVLDTYIGRVAGVEAVELPEPLAAFDCRNNRLAWLGLEQDGFRAAALAARERYGPRRVAVIMGTSTSGVLSTECAYQHREPSGELPAGFRFAETQSTYSVSRARHTSCRPPVRRAPRCSQARRG
jgi:3-oxoacyl-[acyl-carrier-protein] synthase-1